MRLIKRLFFMIMISTMMFVIYPNIKASDKYTTMPKSDGGVITYRNTNIEVMIPTTYNKQEEEFRGVWVSCFAGDLASFSSSEDAFKKDLLAVINTMKSYNLNAIMFHIRTHNDAFYNTTLAPKSNYVSGANFQKWDYLSWFIDECHKNGIEFHAWMNPYRISGSQTTIQKIKEKYREYPKNPANHEENLLLGPKGAILNPGTPTVRKYLIDTCMEVIRKYDIDAIHFDDYFYIEGIDDSKTYEQYKDELNATNPNDFRRLSVDRFIEDLSKSIYDYNISNNRAVQLGISPSGVYKNGNYNVDYQYDENGTLISPLYSNTLGYEHSVSPLFSDTKKWIDNEWIDYITPQMYGSFENKGMPYADIVDWWSHVVKNKKVKLYSGIGLYKMNSNDDLGWANKNLHTLRNILLYNQTHPEVEGFCIYQYKTLKNNSRDEDIKYVRDNFWSSPAINPKSDRYSLEKNEISNLEIYKGNDSYTLIFDKNDSSDRYAIYKSNNLEDLQAINNLVDVIGNSRFEKNSFIDKESIDNIYYGIVAFNRANEVSNICIIESNKAKTTIDFDFGVFNGLKVEGSIADDARYLIRFNKIDVLVGKEATYELYSSYDQENWVIENSYNEGLEQYTFNGKFNDIMKPIYYKVICKNDFGIVNSEVLKVDIRSLKVKNVMNKILVLMNEEFNNILLSEE